MDRIVLPLETTAAGYTHKFVIRASDLTETAANTSQTIALVTVPVGVQVLDAATYLVTPFRDTGDAAFNTTTMTVGDGGSANRYIASQQLNANGTWVRAAAAVNTTARHVYAAATNNTINAVFGSMSGKSLVNINEGEVWIFVKLFDVTKS